MSRSRIVLGGLLVLAFAVAVLGLALARITASPPGQTVPPLPRPDHVVLVMEENHDFASVFGAASAPYINSLARRGAVLTNSHAVTHPSEPNYLALFAGTDEGLSDDSCPHRYSGPNLGSELIAAGRSFVGYAEDLPAPGAQDCFAGSYARKHAPWINFTNVPASASLPMYDFPTDFNLLPTVAMVVPNQANDMHNGSIRAADTWLQQNLDPYVQWAQSHNSLLILQWDEDEGTSSNHILTIFVGPMVAPGQYSEPINHYNLLRTLEDLYGLPHAGNSAGAAPIADVWRSDVHAFPETGHTVQGRFWNYWQTHGGLEQQGYPLSEELQERNPADGRTYTEQYFERAVFEYHPENQPPYDVLLRRLGAAQYAARYPRGAPGQTPNSAQARYFSETRQTLGGGFRVYWEGHGGLAQQGYPISDEFAEVSPDDGRLYTVQYFERAVFEYHPANPDHFKILLRRLGALAYSHTRT